MRLDLLEQRVRVGVCHACYFMVFIIFRGREYSCVSNNTSAYDRLRCDVTYKTRHCYGLTYKKALQSLYDECKRVNCLGEFNNY